MNAVAETAAYLASAKEEGMTEAEQKQVIDTLAGSPDAGELIIGSGGCRKVRIAGKGKGKSGGYRVVTVFGGDHMPVYLIAVLAKGSRANFSKAEVQAMAAVAKRLKEAHRKRAAS
ncbi:MAG: type II toxin-antitoxin system RelE/ParE family toxin [Alphaproteobacteria bacterium]|nr:type II toxin-antitoxin system RelE/ParE family toxin [Alphaproteobacteria bacterium]